MSTRGARGVRGSVGASGRFVFAALVVVCLLMAGVSFLRSVRAKAPTGARARAALVGGQPAEARRLARIADELSAGSDAEALAVLDELDFSVMRAYPSPRERAEAAVSSVPRTEAGRARAEQMFFADADEAVSRDDGSTIEEIRFAVRAWPNAEAVATALVARRELVVLQRCVQATKLICASFFPRVEQRHPAVAARIEGLRARQVALTVQVFRESAALLQTKPEPSVAGAAQRDQVLAAAEHVALSLPEERISAIATYAASHRVEAFHAAPPR